LARGLVFAEWAALGPPKSAMRSGQTRGALMGFSSTVLRWMTAATFAVLAHGAAAWIVLHHPRIDAEASEPAAAALIELEPLAVAPSAPEQEKPPGPQIAEAQPAAPETLPKVDEDEVAAQASEMVERQRDDAKQDSEQPEISEQTSVEDAKRAAAAAESNSVPPPTLEPDSDAPKLTAQDAAEAVLPPAPVKLAETPPEAPQEPQSAVPTSAPPASAPPESTLPALKTPPDVRVESKKATPRVLRTKPAKSEDKLEPRRASAPPASQARLANVEAAPASNGTQASSLASWEGELMAHLNRFKRFPPEAAKGGTAVVAFGVDRAGAIVSVRLIASAGDPALDRAAVGLLGRASPVPPPPSERGVVNLTVPIRFDR
jgi:periplasmic protein TonB